MNIRLSVYLPSAFYLQLHIYLPVVLFIPLTIQSYCNCTCHKKFVTDFEIMLDMNDPGALLAKPGNDT